MNAFIDANVPIYATGADDVRREPCKEILLLAGTNLDSCAVSAEVLQELLHVLLRRRETIRLQAVLETITTSVGHVEPVFGTDVLRAAALDLSPKLQARDRIHLAVMERLGITSIISCDEAFDSVGGITRLDPRDLAAWRQSVFPRPY